MKVRSKLSPRPAVEIEYLQSEWDALEELYKKLGLCVAETSNGFGVGQRLRYYRDGDDILSQILRRTMCAKTNGAFCNSINQPVSQSNIAILRVIPVELKTTAEVKEFFTLYDLRMLSQSLADALRVLLDIRECEIEIKITKGKEGV